MKGLDNVKIAVNDLIEKGYSAKELIEQSQKYKLPMQRRFLNCALEHYSHKSAEYLTLKEELYNVLDFLADRHL